MADDGNHFGSSVRLTETFSCGSPPRDKPNRPKHRAVAARARRAEEAEAARARRAEEAEAAGARRAEASGACRTAATATGACRGVGCSDRSA
jgi:hypothetical protein